MVTEFYNYRVPPGLKGPDEISHPHSESHTFQSSTHPLDSHDEPHQTPTEPSITPSQSVSSHTNSGWRWACDNQGKERWCTGAPHDTNTKATTTIFVFQKRNNGSLELLPCFPDYTGEDPTYNDPEQRSRHFAALAKDITTLNPSACLAFTSKTKQDGTAETKIGWPYRALQSLESKFGLDGIRFRRVRPEIDNDNIGKGEHYWNLGDITYKANKQSLDPREGLRLFEHVKTENEKIATGGGTTAPRDGSESEDN